MIMMMMMVKMVVVVVHDSEVKDDMGLGMRQLACWKRKPLKTLQLQQGPMPWLEWPFLE